MGKKYLAYPIRKKKTGVYHLYLYKGRTSRASWKASSKRNEAVLSPPSSGRVVAQTQKAPVCSLSADRRGAGIMYRRSRVRKVCWFDQNQ